MNTHNIQKGRQEYGAHSQDDPYSWATAAITYVYREMKGDRHKDDLESNNGRWFPKGEGKAPPWRRGPFGEGGRGAAIRDDLAENAVPDIVSEYGIEYMKGLQDHGMLATAKHFPGHGDTETDSH